MTIIIQQKKTGIPVTLGALEFTVDTSDEGMSTLADRYEEVANMMTSVEEGSEMEAAKEVLKEGFDLFLGDGSFELIYEQTPSAMLCAEYLAALMEGVAEEIKKQHTQISKNINKKYLTKKDLSDKHKEVRQLANKNNMI